MTLRTLRRWIPNLTRYRFSAARDHALRQGRGIPPPKEIHRRMYVSQAQVDHFLDFITSPHIIQDLPFGEKSIHLSTGEILAVPNEVRLMIPETLVKQYMSYAAECDFVPLSRRTLLNVLSVCSASVRRSLQGLDYISSTGAEAFDDLCGIADRLGEEFMGLSWAKEQKEHLKSAKRYLKSDFKFHVAKESTVPDHCRQYALSDPKDQNYQATCDHAHDDICDRCEELSEVLRQISAAVKQMSERNVPEESREEMLFVADRQGRAS